MKEQSLNKGRQIGIKIIVIGFLVIALMVPVLLILALIEDRRSSKDQAVQETGAMWGGEQTIGLVFLTIPYTYQIVCDDGSRIEKTRNLNIFPDKLKIDGLIEPVRRKRGIFDVVLYKATVTIDGEYLGIQPSIFPDKATSVDWAGAVLNVGISDIRGIGQAVNMEWGGSPLLSVPGTACSNAVPQGASGKIKLPDNATSVHQFRISFEIRGSGDALFIPAGRETSVSVRSLWDMPSFTGVFLPDTREVTSTGFTADWDISEFNRNLPTTWTAKAPEFSSAAFGVALLEQIDVYRLTTRSIKYAIIFIALTFAAFFLLEILSGIRLHVVHYILVGSAVTLFYLLLVALSEQFIFQYSYITASMATIALISLYLKGVSGSWKACGSIAAVLSLLYLLLFVLLQMETYALLVGSCFLFVLLGAVMMITRNQDWGNRNVAQDPNKNMASA